MKAGEPKQLVAVKPRRITGLPLGEPEGEILRAAETTRRLGEHGIARRGRRCRGSIGGREIDTGGAQGSEGWKARHGRWEMLRSSEHLPFTTACPPISITSAAQPVRVPVRTKSPLHRHARAVTPRRVTRRAPPLRAP